MRTDLVGPFEDGFLNLMNGFAFERGVSMEELIEKYAKSPDINMVVVFCLEEHLWCHIFVSSTESSSFNVYVLSSPTQIAYLNVPIPVH